MKGEWPGAPGTRPWSGPVAWLSRVILVVGAMLVVTCADEDCHGDIGPSYYSYTVESVRYDPAIDRVTVIGLYKPVGWVSECLLPAAAVQHGFQLGEEGFVTFEAATPLGGDLDRRWYAARNANPIRVELEIPGRGVLSVRHRDTQYPSPTALVIPCSSAALLPPDGPPQVVMELRCGYCEEHGCGNGVCEPDEDWYGCNWDCPPPVTVCGDGTCDGTEMGVCAEDCRCTNAECHAECINEPGSTYDYGYCDALDNTGWSGCRCGFHHIRCNGTEPNCDANGDEVIICNEAIGFRAYRGCNQLCWEAFGTGGGYCDVEGIDDCVCEGGSHRGEAVNAHGGAARDLFTPRVRPAY